MSHIAQLFCGAALGAFCLVNFIVISRAVVIYITNRWMEGPHANV